MWVGRHFSLQHKLDSKLDAPRIQLSFVIQVHSRRVRVSEDRAGRLKLKNHLYETGGILTTPEHDRADSFGYNRSFRSYYTW
jgi:hypothetical protein